MLRVDISGLIGTLGIRAKFETPAGNVTALFGASGAGKSTIINMIAGLLKPDSGIIQSSEEIFFDSANLINLPPEKRSIGYVFQDNRLFPHLNVQKNLRYGQNLTIEQNRYLNEQEIIELLDLGDFLKRRPNNLSGGEKKRVALGRALLNSPSILLMDEPMAGLDDKRKMEVLPFIEKINQRFKIPIIYVSHDLDEVIRLADEVGLVKDGEITGLGAVEQMTSYTQFREIVGGTNAVTILQGKVVRLTGNSGLTGIETPAGIFRIPQKDLGEGTKLRLRLNASDISIATEKPQYLSILNVIPGTIKEIQQVGPGTVSVAIEATPDTTISAQITQHACQALSLTKGKTIFALVKSVAIDRFGQG